MTASDRTLMLVPNRYPTAQPADVAYSRKRTPPLFITYPTRRGGLAVVSLTLGETQRNAM